MLDTINLERKGVPAAVIGHDKLFATTGKGMARAQGYPSLSFAMFRYSHSEWGGAATDDELRARAAILAPQVERILLGDA
ncbi:MAG: hypothetical protein IT531_01725 [Burkholderiales bacterium]|nr:hypothetical protein [Burkholderiales bacterium]